MKKTLITLTLAAGIGLGGIAYAQNVGEAMPNYRIGTLPSCVRDIDGMDGIVVTFKNFRGMTKYKVAHLVCQKRLVKKPFGIYDFEKRKLYLDNNPTDGIIDKVLSGDDATRRPIYKDAPKCMLPI